MNKKSDNDNYMQLLTIVECRDCGTIWYEGDENITLKPGEEISLLYAKRSAIRCKWCRNKAMGRGGK